MDRLTKRTPKGDAYLANVKDDEQAVDCKSRNTAQCIMDSWDRLADYEDTGLTPADIADLRNELCLKCGKYHTAHLGSCDGCRWRNNSNA